MKNILIVEDDLSMQKFIEEAIYGSIENIKIFKTMYAEKALEILNETQIDIFIIDIQLLDYSGIELAKKIRAIPTYEFTPIIVETALKNQKLDIGGEIICQWFLSKPYVEKHIVYAVNKVMKLLSKLNLRSNKLEINKSGLILQYNCNEILYIQSIGQDIEIVMYDSIKSELVKKEVKRYLLKDIFFSIKDNGFIMCHRSYIINEEYIQEIDFLDNEVILKYDVRIPIGSTYRNKLKRRK